MNFRKKRRGSGYALLIVGVTIFAFGIVWAVLYWGGMLPLQANIVSQFTVGIFPTAQYQFMVEMGVFWGFIVTIALLIWLYNQSNRRDGPVV